MNFSDKFDRKISPNLLDFYEPHRQYEELSSGLVLRNPPLSFAFSFGMRRMPLHSPFHFASPIHCFVSHKCMPGEPGSTSSRCGLRDSAFGRILVEVFTDHGITLAIDPIGAGEQVSSRIESVTLQAFLYLSCPESNQSEWCQAELKIARQRHVPIFVIRLRGEIALFLQDRLFVDCPDGDRKEIPDADRERLKEDLRELAGNVHVRGIVYQTLEGLPRLPHFDQDKQIRTLVSAVDSAVFTEFFDLLDRVYRRDEIAPATRYQLALIVGRTKSPKGESLLQLWEGIDDHPLVTHGLQEASSMLGLASTYTDTQHARP